MPPTLDAEHTPPTPPPISTTPDGLLGVVVQHTAELARMDTLIEEVERRLGGVERNQITLSGQLQGNITKTDRLEVSMLQFGAQLSALLVSVGELKQTAERTHTTLQRWDPTLEKVVPLLEERAYEAQRAAHTTAQLARFNQHIAAVASGLGVLGALGSVLFAVTQWSVWKDWVARYPVVPWVYALVACAAIVSVIWVVWRPRHAGSP